MEVHKYRAIQEHISEYPQPITFAKGAPLTVGEKYAGPEDWDNWFFCDTPGQEGGWVPEQVIQFVDDNTAWARQDYTARELNIQEGEELTSTRTLNGWAWCERSGSSESGWVPLEKLRKA